MRVRLEGGSLSPLIPRKLAHVYCFLFGHDCPCGTYPALCQRCYKATIDNPWAISIRSLYWYLFVRARYKFWLPKRAVNVV